MVSATEVRRIPVRPDPRTLGQGKKEMVSQLEQKYTSPSAEETKVAKTSPAVNEWNNEVNHWIDNTYKLWNDEMRRMREGMFSLVPVAVDPLSIAGPVNDVPSLITQMDRQLEALRTLPDALNQPMLMPEELVSRSIVPRFEDPLSFLKDAYELGEDGRVHFKVLFNLQGFNPKDVVVKTSHHHLNVHAKKSVKTANSESTSEYCRTIYVPPTVDDSKLDCTLTNDGVLVVQAPLKDVDYKALTFDKNRQLGIHPVSGNAPSGTKALALKPTGQTGVVVQKEGDHNKVHVEFPIEPEFDPKDICVRADENQVVVTGKHEQKEGSGSNRSMHLKEFTRSYAVPETLDPLSVQARLAGNVMVVEAPLLKAK